ncbi:fatty acid beta-hydroxylating cytochrome P450 [Niallia circulans]|uniref:Cytochrome P450 n=1 Tax=Niallia circulans TaxID=1397 RepID=A0A0J1ICD1_NIACI|nr:cytochrome P450 [Niallia circulans]KLV23634.1 cytochrome P450 [Niallia circulans]MDR4316430.1 cytochrome P450 [Niallia circulans]MED3838397.1 cytochrome P450 [Niallia circulans]MED4243871.1 cytochrome P450 [Niallia circulans]MED4246264.1 cytochrome P450 [Niallia circulans]
MPTNSNVPSDKGLDKTITLLKEGYLFINNRMDKFNTDIFTVRLLGQNVICIKGEEAVKIFYDTEKFQRNGAAPNRVQQSLFGKNAVQTMDDEKHLHRKLLFMSLLTPEHQQKLANLTTVYLEEAIKQWEQRDQIVLFDEIKNILCKVACQWAGVPLAEEEILERADDFIAMVYAFGTLGPEHWKGRMARNRAERWIRQVIEEVREGKLETEQGTALHEMAFYEKIDGTRLDTEMAAIELINVLRPIVAIATFITFSALAFHEYKEQREKLRTADDRHFDMFVHEVRRYYPFGPFLGARVRTNFMWKNQEFKEGTLVLLDIYGTNHDARLWENPNQFNPSRFENWQGGLYDFIPHGGGDPAKGHRCPGEGVTVELMKVVLRTLATELDYDVPVQDLHYDLSQMPTLPKSGFIMNNVKKR